MKRGFFFLRCLLCLFTLCLLIPLADRSQSNENRGRLRPASTAVTHYYQPVGKPQSGSFTCQQRDAPVLCYNPAQIREAYAIQSLHDQGITGKGRTIVVLDAFDAPHIGEDLKLFSQTFGLPDAELAVHYPNGKTSFDPSIPDHISWSAEITLDVEWAHVVAPEAKIALVLAKSSDDGDMYNALKYAVENDLGDVISMSFGQNEKCMQKKDTELWHTLFNEATQKKMTLVAASGDTGAALPTCDDKSYEKAVPLPASDPLVTAIGGTRLFADEQKGHYKYEVSWNEPESHVAGGGGFSTYYPKPSYQFGAQAIDGQRGLPDVSYNAALNGGFLVAWSDGPAGPGNFYVNGGTSAGTPQWAGIVALTNQYAGKRIGFLNLALYFIGRTDLYTQTFRDVYDGHNTVTMLSPDGKQLIDVQGYRANRGWDAATGWGTPLVNKLVPTLAEIATNEGKMHM